MSHEALVELSKKLFIVVTDNAYFYNELIDNLSGLRITNESPLTAQLTNHPTARNILTCLTARVEKPRTLIKTF